MESCTSTRFVLIEEKEEGPQRSFPISHFRVRLILFLVKCKIAQNWQPNCNQVIIIYSKAKVNQSSLQDPSFLTKVSSSLLLPSYLLHSNTFMFIEAPTSLRIMNICSGNTGEICKSDDIIKEKDDLIVKLPLIYTKKYSLL